MKHKDRKRIRHILQVSDLKIALRKERYRRKMSEAQVEALVSEVKERKEELLSVVREAIQIVKK
jgi:hypothetical protein